MEGQNILERILTAHISWEMRESDFKLVETEVAKKNMKQKT